MITIDDIKRVLGEHCMLWADGLTEVSGGKIRFETKYKYPDGGSIELYLVQEDGVLPGLEDQPHLTDLGETMTWLFHAQIKPWTSAKRRAFVEAVLEQYKVHQDGGELLMPVSSVDKLGEDIIELGQACLRISDLVFTKRISISSPIVDQVESALDDAELNYRPDVEIHGRFGKAVRLDFLVDMPKRPPSGILTLSSNTKSSAHVTANELFSRWYDLKDVQHLGKRLTVFDDRQDTYRSEDLERLEDVSEVVPVSDTRKLVDLLEAA